MSKMCEKEPWWWKVVLLPMIPIWFTIGLVKSSVIAVKLIKSGVRPDREEFMDELTQEAKRQMFDDDYFKK